MSESVVKLYPTLLYLLVFLVALGTGLRAGT